MHWDEVKSFLIATLLPLMRNPRKGRRWVDSLSACPDGKQLATSIAIDLRSGSLPTLLIAKLIDTIRLPSMIRRFVANVQAHLFGHFHIRRFAFRSPSDPRIAFDLALTAYGRKELVCSSFHRDSNMDADDHYARVLELADFITYYLRDHHYTLNPSDIARAKAIYCTGPHGIPLGHIQEWWTGKHENVWVCSMKEISNLITPLEPGTRGSTLCDALGRHIPWGIGPSALPLLMLIRYPKHFSLPCPQPTSLDASWLAQGTFYISYKKHDAWGRTHTLTPLGTPLRERVHSHFKGLTNDYSISCIGHASPIAVDRTRIVADAYERFLEPTS